jgi:hypothetical protein
MTEWGYINTPPKRASKHASKHPPTLSEPCSTRLFICPLTKHTDRGHRHDRTSSTAPPSCAVTLTGLTAAVFALLNPTQQSASPHQRFRSAGLCLQTAVSPLSAEILNVVVKFRHARLGPLVASSSGADDDDDNNRSAPRSTSSSPSSSSPSEPRGIGIAAEGASLRGSASRAWRSSAAAAAADPMPTGWRARWFEWWWPWAMDRTTSPLQMGQVRRRRTSQGVLSNQKVLVQSRSKTLG